MPPIFMNITFNKMERWKWTLCSSQEFRFKTDQFPYLRVIGARILEHRDCADIVFRSRAHVREVERGDPGARILTSRFLGLLGTPRK